MNPRDALPHGIVLKTEVDDHCNELAVDRHKYCQLRLTEDGPVYYMKYPPLSN